MAGELLTYLMNNFLSNFLFEDFPCPSRRQRSALLEPYFAS